MMLTIITGGDRNLIRITAETMHEANDILCITTSKFVKEHPSWFSGPFPAGESKIAFDIYISKTNATTLSQEVLSELDQES